MIENYTAIVILSCLTLGILSILVFENARLDKDTKYRFYRTYTFIVVASVAEWAGVFLNGAPGWTMGIHSLVKCIDYIFTPIAGVCFALQISNEKNIKKHIWMYVILMANTVLEIISLFTGWTFYVDVDNYYYHGPLYFVYAIIYCSVLASVLFLFRNYSKNFRRKNRGSLYGIIVLVCLGILLQEIFSMRTSCLSLAFGSVLLFIHYNEFLQQKNDENLDHQRTLIETDALTGMLSRYAYIETMAEYDQNDTLPENLVVFSIDVNGLKIVNDTMGHSAGDELICGAAQCIHEIFGKYGKCFRTGGDEFVAIIEIDKNQLTKIQKMLDIKVEKWRGKIVNSLSISSGYAIAEEHPGVSIEKMVNIADKIMYANKEMYYQNMGFSRFRTMPEISKEDHTGE